MVSLTPEVLSVIGTVVGGGVTGGYAVWKKLGKVFDTGQETKKGVDELKNGVMQEKIRTEVDAALGPITEDVAELKEGHRHVVSRIDAIYNVMIKQGQDQR